MNTHDHTGPNAVYEDARMTIYYDVEYSHKTDEPGAACIPGRPATGGDVIYDSPDGALANVNDFIDPANGSFPSFDERFDLSPGF